MFKINIMQIMKFITAVVCFSLFGFAVYSMNQSKASPLPFLICACILYVVDGIPAVKTNVTSEGLALKASFNAAIWAALLIALLLQQTDTEVIG